MNICMRCTGTNTITGKIVSRKQEAATAFKPDGMKFWSFSLTGGVDLAKSSLACLDCGFVWNETDPVKLAAFVAKKCKATPSKG